MTTFKVLIISEEPIISYGLKAQFEKWGSSLVRIEDTYASALQQYALLGPTLLIIDFHFSNEKDGLETARDLHTQHPVPIIFLSDGHGEAEINSLPYTEQFRHINKPCHPTELQEAVESLLAIKLLA